jgi:hypothetical protein
MCFFDLQPGFFGSFNGRERDPNVTPVWGHSLSLAANTKSMRFRAAQDFAQHVKIRDAFVVGTDDPGIKNS